MARRLPFSPTLPVAQCRLRRSSQGRLRRALALLVALLAASPAAAEKRFYIQPLGGALDDASVTLVATALRRFYGLDVQVRPRLPLPKSAYYAPRRRYRAEKLLDFLAAHLPADGDRVLGLASVDISTTKGPIHDWGVLGLGAMGGESCVVSSFRARKKSRDPAHARERLAKVAVHEIGHTLGLPHCPTVGCLMEDAQGKVATTDREYDLCPACRARVAGSGRTLPAAPQIPWARP